MAMFIATTALTAELTLESAPPVVVKTVPVAGASSVDPNLAEIQATFSKPMMDGSWSWSMWGEENYPETTGEPRYLTDRRSCVLPVKLQAGRFYAIWLNSERLKNFKDAGGHAAVPYLLTFTTASTNVAVLRLIPKAEELPGKPTFHGRYRHRNRGTDIETPSELWLKESPDGGVSALARLPFSESSELVTGNREHQISNHRIGRDAIGAQTGYRVELEFTNATARLTRRGIRQDCDGRELNVPDGAWFDPNSRPDSYLAANILLRAFALREGETKDFPVYDWDNSGEEFAPYTIRVRHAGKEKVEVPAGTFEANHLVLTQTTSADTWFKKRAGHVTDFWVLDNGVIVRVLRQREPYEMVLLDYTVPEKLGARLGNRTH